MVLDKKCKNCGAKVVFDPKTQLLHCEYCNSNHEITEETDEQIKESSKELDVYNCPSCGAQIICEPNTTSTFCVYCKNTAILKDKLKGEFFPQAIIPFHSTKEEAINAFIELRKGKRLIPDAFLDKKNIEEIRGIYIPFWFFDYEIDGQLDAKTEQETRIHGSSHTTITTREYTVLRSGTISYDNIPIDGSTHFQDNIMRSIEPFDYNGLRKYSSDYLSGFLSELYDVKKEDAYEIAKQRATTSAYELFYKSISEKGYTKINVTSSNFNIINSNIQYVLLPVWMLNVKYKDQFYTFAMNGQTKKMIGNIPVDKKKAVKFFFMALLLSILICGIFAIIIWKAVW